MDTKSEDRGWFLELYSVCILGEGVFYLLDYVTSTDLFQISDRKKKKKKEKTWTPFIIILRSLPKLSDVLK